MVLTRDKAQFAALTKLLQENKKEEEEVRSVFLDIHITNPRSHQDEEISFSFYECESGSKSDFEQDFGSEFEMDTSEMDSNYLSVCDEQSPDFCLAGCFLS
jgi:hypothetical protein